MRVDLPPATIGQRLFTEETTSPRHSRRPSGPRRSTVDGHLQPPGRTSPFPRASPPLASILAAPSRLLGHEPDHRCATSKLLLWLKTINLDTVKLRFVDDEIESDDLEQRLDNMWLSLPHGDGGAMGRETDAGRLDAVVDASSVVVLVRPSASSGADNHHRRAR